jgi:hypothetical protein
MLVTFPRDYPVFSIFYLIIWKVNCESILATNYEWYLTNNLSVSMNKELYQIVNELH